MSETAITLGARLRQKTAAAKLNMLALAICDISDEAYRAADSGKSRIDIPVTGRGWEKLEEHAVALLDMFYKNEVEAEIKNGVLEISWE